ncbi:hypothetical protein Rhopal_005944-T1 [Rhodotorula paludigena]|uniref:Uncharacterized protein n=1 Tax=Rhodotorula paludigena TaxID=86838 RepID=A0AAV5GQV0_9BASI|nr:hypothetical protein Rhopal_005944-T1 [Rhodotorula paludigena]
MAVQAAKLGLKGPFWLGAQKEQPVNVAGGTSAKVEVLLYNQHFDRVIRHIERLYMSTWLRPFFARRYHHDKNLVLYQAHIKNSANVAPYDSTIPLITWTAVHHGKLVITKFHPKTTLATFWDRRTAILWEDVAAGSSLLDTGVHLSDMSTEAMVLIAVPMGDNVCAIVNAMAVNLAAKRAHGGIYLHISATIASLTVLDKAAQLRTNKLAGGPHCLARRGHVDPAPGVPPEETWEYLYLLHAHYEFHSSSNILTNDELQPALTQRDPLAVAAAVAGSRGLSVNGCSGELSEALGWKGDLSPNTFADAVAEKWPKKRAYIGHDGWLLNHLAESHGWFGGHGYDDLLNCSYNNHFWKGSVAHLVPCGLADSFIPLPIHPTRTTTIFLEAGLEAYKSGQPGPGKRSQARWDATTLNTPASVILSPSYAGQHLDRYSVIAAIGLANRIQTFYRKSHAATASNRTPPELLIVITSSKLSSMSLTTLAVYTVLFVALHAEALQDKAGLEVQHQK